MILVTGGTGLVGSHLLYHLSLQENELLAIYRSKETIENVKKVFSFYNDSYEVAFRKIKWIQADITDIPSLEMVFQHPISKVYHCAAMVSFYPKDYQKMRFINIKGTANLINFSIHRSIAKFCYVSSIAAIGDSVNNSVVTEENEWIDTCNKHGYAITKYGGEMEVWRGSQEGIDVVIVNPGVILGSGFFNDGSGKLFTQVANGFKFYTEGVTGFVSVKDVVTSMIQLTNSSIKNERFILVSENKSFKEILFEIAKNLNVNPPHIKATKLMTGIFWRIDWLISKLTGKAPLMTKNSARSSHNKEQYDASKLKKAIGIDFQPIPETIKEVCIDFKKN